MMKYRWRFVKNVKKFNKKFTANTYWTEQKFELHSLHKIYFCIVLYVLFHVIHYSIKNYISLRKRARSIFSGFCFVLTDSLFILKNKIGNFIRFFYSFFNAKKEKMRTKHFYAMLFLPFGWYVFNGILRHSNPFGIVLKVLLLFLLCATKTKTIHYQKLVDHWIWTALSYQFRNGYIQMLFSVKIKTIKQRKKVYNAKLFRIDVLNTIPLWVFGIFRLE